MQEDARRAVAAARATLQETVYFDYDESDIRADAERSLRANIALVLDNARVAAQIATAYAALRRTWVQGQ